MKSHSIAKYFLLLEEQRTRYLPAIRTLSQEELWHRPYENKWSIGEHFYHLYLIFKMLNVVTKYTLFFTPIAKIQRNKPFATEIHDIYAAYPLKKGKGMPAPKILLPPKKICFVLSGCDIEHKLVHETLTLQKLVKDIEEDIAGHIRFPDPVAHYPNLIQAIQLLAIHEQQHFNIMEKSLSPIK